MKKLIEQLSNIRKDERNYIIFELLRTNKLSFPELSEIYVASLKAQIKENRAYEVRGAIALEAFRPGGMFKGVHKMKNPKSFVGGMDGFKVMALLFLKHSGMFREELLNKELEKIDKKIVEDEQKAINFDLT